MSFYRYVGTAGFAAALACGIIAPADAQVSTDPAISVSPDARFDFDVPPLPLEKAAMALCEQAGLQLVMDGDIARDLNAGTIKATGTVAQTFDALLAPTTLRWRFVGPRTIAIGTQGDPPGGNVSILLAPLRVEGSRDDRSHDDEAARWDREVRQRLERHKRYPAEAQQLGLEDVVYLRISSDRSGNVLGTDIVQSHGISLLDEAAREVVRRAGRLPKLPKALEGSPFRFVIPLVFYLR